MLYICVYLLVLLDLYEAEEKFDYKIQYKKPYIEGHVCNYETWHLREIQYVLYTCVPRNKCRKGSGLYARRPELHYDNCPHTFLSPPGGPEYTCCHPQDFIETKYSPNATINPLRLRFMPGFRSGFKCNEYAKFVCLNDTFCPEEYRLKKERRKHTRTSIEKYPHVAVLGWMDDVTNEQSWFCRGSVVSERFVLTAHSCRQDNQGRATTLIRVGEDTICNISVNCDSDGNKRQYTQLLHIEKQFHHPRRDPRYFYHDLMLLRTIEEIYFTPKVRPACLFREMNKKLGGGSFPVYEYPAEGEDDRFQTIHEILPDLESWSNTFCNEYYEGSPRLVDSVVDVESMICAGLPRGVPGVLFNPAVLQGSQPCENDYGGALVDLDAIWFKPRCMWEIYGVMSWGQEYTCNLTKPPIFTRTSYYLEWLEESMWPDFDILKEYRRLPLQCIEPVALALGAQTSDEGRCYEPDRPSF